MTWTAIYTYTVGQTLTAANLNTYLSGNTQYLKSQTDILSISAYNNDSITLNQYDPIVWDPLYTSGLGVKSTTNSPDYRATGIVISSSISSHATGLVYFPGFYLTNINVTGAVAFGHSLITSASAHYAADSGGGGNDYGTLGWALGTSPSGNATISALLRAYPLFFTAAQVVTNKYGANDIPSTTLQTFNANVANATANQLLLFFAYNSTALTSPTWNSLTPTLVASDASNQAYIGYLLGSSAATSNFQGTFNNTSQNGTAVTLALNGVNQGGGANTFGAWAHQGGSGAVNVTVACAPGDYVILCVTVRGTGMSFSGRNQTLLITGVGSSSAYDVQFAVATSTSVNFTVTVAGASTVSADGVALHSA
jgi:hypothetical protein